MQGLVEIALIWLLGCTGSLGASGTKPRLSPFVLPINAVEGVKVKVICSSLEGSSPLYFQWLKDGKPLGTDFILNIQNLEDASLLTIDKLNISHTGNYTCSVKNAFGSDLYSASLAVNAPPKWVVKPPPHLTLGMGRTQHLNCLAEGFPLPATKWTRKNKLGSQPLNSLPNGTLVIVNANKEHEGQYMCSVSSIVGRDLVVTVSVNVQVPARFAEGEEKFSVQNVKRGESASIRCQSVGDHPLSVQWFRDKQPVDLKASSRYDHYETKSDRGLNSELLIRTTERADGALYTCLAKNDYGQEERNIKLLVVEVPEPPLDVRVGEVWSKSATITWSQPYNGNSQLVKYMVHYWRDDKSFNRNHRLQEVDLKASVTSHMIKDLSPGMNYAVSVIGVNEVGYGEPSQPYRFFTGEEEPTGPPTDVNLEAKGSKTVLVSWKCPPRDQWNGNITGYYIQYRPHDVTQPYIKTIPASFSKNTSRIYSYILGGLTKSKAYRISVKAYNNAGAGPPSQELMISTLDGDVTASPKFEGYQLISKSMVKLQWKLAAADKNEIAGFVLYCKRNDLDLFTNIIPLPKHQTNHVIQNLEPGVKYSFFLTTVNAFGESDLSEPLLVNLHTSPLGFTLLLAESNLLLITAFMVSIVSIVIAILASIIYVKRFKAQQEEQIRQYSTLSAADAQRYREKCGTTRSTATYATIPGIAGHVTIRSSGSNSASSSGGYGGGGSDPDEIRTLQSSRRMSKQSMGSIKKRDFEECIYDESPAE